MTDKLKDARDAVEDALDLDSLGFKTWCRLQSMYFDLEFMVRAREPGLEYADFAPSEYTLSDGEFVDFGGVKVSDPSNPFTEHAVTIDHVVSGDGDVRCRVNGLDVAEIGAEPGSHIR